METINSLSALHQNQQSTDALKSIFSDSCSKHGVPDSQKDNLINNGMPLFEISSNGDVFPLNVDYPTIASYVLKHVGNTVQPVDSTEVTKEQLYNQLSKAANSQNMLEYRSIREAYSTM